MMERQESAPGLWVGGALPANVQLGVNTMVTGDLAFKRFHSTRDPALVIGADCTIDGAQFALGEHAQVQIGNHCYFTNAVLLSELDIRIGNFVMIGWNTTIADTDFHPIAPAQRVVDAIALSPLGNMADRPPIPRKAVIIDDDVWIGASVVILKGVHIGKGAFIEPGSVVTRDVPPGARVIGNPARPIGAPS